MKKYDYKSVLHSIYKVHVKKIKKRLTNQGAGGKYQYYGLTWQNVGFSI